MSKANTQTLKRMYRQILATRSSIEGSESLNSANSEHGLAIAIYDQGRFDEAENHFRHVLRILQEALGPTHRRTIQCLSNLANALREQAQYEAAEELHREAVELSQSALVERHPIRLNCTRNLAITLVARQRYDEAETLLRAALATLRTSGPRSSQEHNIARELAEVLEAQGKLSDAGQVLKSFLESELETHRPDDTRLAGTMLLAAFYHSTQGKHAEAIEYSRVALEIFDRVLGPTDQRTTLSKHQLSASCGNYALELAKVSDPKNRDPAKILRLAESAVRVRAEIYPSEGQPYNILGVALYWNARWQDAVDAFKKASELEGDKSGHLEFFRAMANWRLGRRDLALEEYVQAVRLLEECPFCDPAEHNAFREEAESLIPREAIDAFRKEHAGATVGLAETEKPSSTNEK